MQIMQLKTENLVKSFKGRKVVAGAADSRAGEVVGFGGRTPARQLYFMVYHAPEEGNKAGDEDITNLLCIEGEKGISYLPQAVCF